MEVSTTTISVIDLINQYKEVAHLNAEYLGISVAILGGLGVIFSIFNLKPLKESLNKQEIEVKEIRKEAHELLDLSRTTVDEVLEEFKGSQTELLSIKIKQQEEKLNLETENKIREVENTLIEKIGLISEDKDVKLKEIVLSESTNKLATTEKELIATLSKTKEDLEKSLIKMNGTISELTNKVNGFDEDIKELQLYKFSKEGKRGAVIRSIQLLTLAIDKYKKDNLGDWKVTKRLKGLIEEIKDIIVNEEDVADIKEQLERVKDDSKFKELIDQIYTSLKYDKIS